MNLTEICSYLHNWFSNDDDKTIGAFTISGGEITPSIDLLEGQYYRIVGSALNDGVYKSGDTINLKDEQFVGGIWKMRVPQEVLDLEKDIIAYETKYGEATPYTSESFGGYSYSKGSSNNGSFVTWIDVFSSKLAQWRKI